MILYTIMMNTLFHSFVEGEHVKLEAPAHVLPPNRLSVLLVPGVQTVHRPPRELLLLHLQLRWGLPHHGHVSGGRRSQGLAHRVRMDVPTCSIQSYSNLLKPTRTTLNVLKVKL